MNKGSLAMKFINLHTYIDTALIYIHICAIKFIALLLNSTKLVARSSYKMYIIQKAKRTHEALYICSERHMRTPFVHFVAQPFGLAYI